MVETRVRMKAMGERLRFSAPLMMARTIERAIFSSRPILADHDGGVDVSGSQHTSYGAGMSSAMQGEGEGEGE